MRKAYSMKFDVRGCSTCPVGEERWEVFATARRPDLKYYQYDYRHTDGKLFSTVSRSLLECRSRRDGWLKTR